MKRPAPVRRRAGVRVTTLLLALCLSACGGGGGTPATPATPAPATTLTVNSSATELHAGGQPLALTATLNGAGAVNWQLAPGSIGSLSAASGASINYLPPSQVTAPAQVTITATSAGLSKSIVLQLLPPAGLSLIAGDIGGKFVLDGQGVAARFGGILNATRDGAGNLYVADYNDTRKPTIRKVAADGSVTTIAHDDWFISDGAYGAAVIALSVAPDGSVYLLQKQSIWGSNAGDRYTHYVRKLNADGSLTTIGKLPDNVYASNLVAAAGGTVYLLAGDHVGQMNAAGSYQVLAGVHGQGASPDVDGSGAAARFSTLFDMVAGADGTLYVADERGVRQVSTKGVVTTLAHIGPGPTDGDAASAGLQGPRSVALDASGAVLVLDRPIDNSANYYEVRRIAGGTIHTLFRQNDPAGLWAGQCGRTGTQDTLLRMGADGALLAIGAAAVARLDADGTRHPFAGLDNSSGLPADGQGAMARYCDPGMMAADHDGNLYTIDGGANDAPPFQHRLVVRKTTPSGQVSTLPQTADSKPSGLVVDAAGRLLLALRPVGANNLPTDGGAIYWLQPGGAMTLVAGQPGPNSAVPLQHDGSATEARFGGPTLLGADADGNVYLSDYDQHNSAHTTLRKLSPQGVVSTIASLPPSLNAAPDGYVYQADYNKRVLYRLAPDGSRTDLPGSGERAWFGALPVQFDYGTALVPTGPHTFAVIAGSAVLRLVLP